MLCFGLLPGGLAGLLGLWLSTPPRFHLGVLGTTLALFFLMGFVLRERAADFAVTCLHALVLLAVAPGGGEPESGAFSRPWCLATLLCWIALVTLLLLRY